MELQHMPLWAKILLEDTGRSQTRGHDSDAPHEGLRDDDEIIEIPSNRAAAAVPAGHCLVLMAHGSRDPRWRGTFECLHASLEARFGEGIRLAYMEFVGPTLMEVARQCHAEGVRTMRVLPLFMAGGAHVATDIPEQIAEVRAAFPEIEVEALAPIGEDPRMFAILQEIIGEHASFQPQRAIRVA